MKRFVRFLSFIMTFLMTFAPATAWASEQVDFNKTGSVKVSIKDHEKDKEVPGGSLLLYKVAELKQSEDTLYYEFAESFGQFEYEFSDSEYIDIIGSDGKYEFTAVDTSLDIENPELAGAITSYIKEHKLEGKSLEVSEAGLAKADNLKLGLYLIMQDKTAEGYSPINSFLFNLPMEDEGKLVYDVDASPKVETKPEETEPSETETSETEPSETEPSDNPPGNPGKPGNPSKPGKPGNPHLPQTGQLWWPVPILAFAGLLLFTIGWKKRYNSR